MRWLINHDHLLTTIYLHWQLLLRNAIKELIRFVRFTDGHTKPLLF